MVIIPLVPLPLLHKLFPKQGANPVVMMLFDRNNPPAVMLIKFPSTEAPVTELPELLIAPTKISLAALSRTEPATPAPILEEFNS